MDISRLSYFQASADPVSHPVFSKLLNQIRARGFNFSLVYGVLGGNITISLCL